MRSARVFTPTGAVRAWVTILLAIVGLAATVGLTIGYVARTRAEDDRRWCALLGTLVQPQPTSPPQTPQEARGRKVTEQIRQLYHELGCDR